MTSPAAARPPLLADPELRARLGPHLGTDPELLTALLIHLDAARSARWPAGGGEHAHPPGARRVAWRRAGRAAQARADDCR